MKTFLRHLRSRFNPRLHPVLAMGIGFAVAVLLLPGAGPETERHTPEEILARLVAPESDLEHGPLFWLAHLRVASELATRARALCEQGLYQLRPGCQMLATLEALTALPRDVVPITQPPPVNPELPEGEPQ